MEIRSLKVELHPTSRQKDLLYGMMRSSAEIYNLLVDYLQYKRDAYRQLKEQGVANPWEEDEFANVLQKGWATDLIRTLIPEKSSVYPKKLINKPAKNGKAKGVDRFVVETRKNARSDYGVPGQTQGLICADFESNIKSTFTHWRNGNYDAELPKRKKGLHTLFFSTQIAKKEKDLLTLGTGDYTISFRLPEIKHLKIQGEIKISRTRGGIFYLHLTCKHEVERNPELTEVAAVDFGQKRAMVLALKDGSTATISGKNICALKRERGRRYRGIGRKRSKVLSGQIRQYLTPEEKQVYRGLQLKDNDRQRQGKKRTGADVKYAFRIIRQRRKDLGLNKRSKRQRILLRAQNKAGDYYRIRLSYANHSITRAAVSWCVDNKVGKVYVGDLKSLPKRRKKGQTRIKQVHRNNLWEMPTQVKYLDEKLQLAGAEGTEERSERLSSQVCPGCGRRHKPRNRVYFCDPRKGGCGWTGDRDGVGACNFLSSVIHGVCGDIEPAHNKTLRISPAIRQGLRMPTPVNIVGSEPVEEVAKGYTSSDVQAPVNVQDAVSPRTTRKPRTAGKTQARGGNEVLATSDPSEFDDTCSQLTTSSGREINEGSRGILQNSLEKPVQLSFWDAR